MKSSKSKTTSAAPGGKSEPPTQASKTHARPAGALTVVAPGTLKTDALMGEQLTAQFTLATGGAVEVLKFGAMMLMLREHVESACKTKKSLSNEERKNTGVKAWLKEFAPKVKEGTAYRFLHVAEAVAAEFALPAKVSFIALATTPAADLSPKLRKKQQDLWDFVSGTSQRSWLDRFAPAKPKGGLHPKQGPELSDEEKYQAALEQIRKDHVTTFTVLTSLTSQKAFQALPEPELHLAIDTAEKFIAEAKAWAETPKSKRTIALNLKN